jgi:hypothetical protein
MTLGPAQLVVRTVCVHNHLSIVEQPQTETTTPMSGHELDTHSIDTGTVAGHRMSYHEYVPGAYYGLKNRAPQKRYLVTVLGLQLLYSRYSRVAGPAKVRLENPHRVCAGPGRAALGSNLVRDLSFRECTTPEASRWPRDGLARPVRVFWEA